MIDSNKLIKDIAIDVVSVITVWGLINSSVMSHNFYIDINNKYFNINNNINLKTFLTITGVVTSLSIISKYY